MTFSAAVVMFEDAAYDRLLHRAQERGLSLAEGRTLEWLLDGGEVGRPLQAKSSAPPPPKTPRATPGR